VSNVSPGNYTVTIIDKFLCEETFNYNLTEPAAMQVTSNSINETYFQANDGTASVNVSGGVPPYTYYWSNGGTSSTINNLAPGNYNVTIFDSNGCVNLFSGQ